jgi:hypothetical protein
MVMGMESKWKWNKMGMGIEGEWSGHGVGIKYNRNGMEMILKCYG